MPIYDYVCESCGDFFTTTLPVEKRDEVECRECLIPMSRIKYAPAIKFKGSGFHKNDYN